MEVAEDPVEPFSPNNEDTLFDDIEASQEPREPSIPLPVQARSLRASPSIRIVSEVFLDANQECHRALCTLRAQVCELLDICFLLCTQVVSASVRGGARL
jgi:hypothetical protein